MADEEDVPSWSELSETQKERLIRTARNEYRPRHGGAGHLPTAAGEWRSGQVIGEGGEGVALVFKKVDTYQRVTDSTVLKVIQLGVDAYDDKTRYYKDPDDSDTTDNHDGALVPGEAFCQGLVSNRRSDFKYSVRMRAWIKSERLTRWLIYSDYCVYEQSLEQLIAAHAKPGADDEESEPSHPIPEPAVWYFAECLAQAAVAMKTVPTRSRARAATDDQTRGEVVHTDTKPENIYLDLADPLRFRAYPIIKVGDYGGARYTTMSDANNPTSFLEGVTTKGYIPPELWPDPEDPDSQLEPLDPPYMLDEKTNIGQIGKVLMSIVSLQTRIKVRRRHQIKYDEAEDPDDWTYPVADDLPDGATYSEELLALINRCLMPLPNDRPTGNELRQNVAAASLGHVRGMDTVEQRRLPHGHPCRLGLAKTHQYGEGMSRARAVRKV